MVSDVRITIGWDVDSELFCRTLIVCSRSVKCRLYGDSYENRYGDSYENRFFFINCQSWSIVYYYCIFVSSNLINFVGDVMFWKSSAVTADQ